jgi:hypothetical protein
MRTYLLVCGLSILAGCTIVVAAPHDGDARYSHENSMWGSGPRVDGNGQLATDKRAVDAGVTELEVSGMIDADIRVGSAATLEIEADSNLLPLIRTESRGGTLRIWMEGSFRTDHDIRARLTLPALSRVEASGSGHVNVIGLNGKSFKLRSSGSRSMQLAGKLERLDLRLSGSSRVDATGLAAGDAHVEGSGSSHVQLGQINGEELEVDLSGSGALQTAGGSVRRLHVSLSGAGHVNVNGLVSQTASLSATGSADIRANVTQTLSASTSGAGRIVVAGNPAQRSVSGRGVTVQ